MSTTLLKEVLADKEAFAQAREEAGLIIARVLSDTFPERERAKSVRNPRLQIERKPDETPAVPQKVQ